MNAPFQHTATLREVDLADPGEVRRLEALVAEHPGGTAFHRPAWLLAAARATGNRATALVLERRDAIAAYLPLLEVHSPLFGRVMVSSGFGVEGGILAERAADGDALFAAAEELALRRSCPAIELRGGMLPAGVNPADPDAGEPPYAFYQEAHNQVVLNGGGTVRRLRKQPATT